MSTKQEASMLNKWMSKGKGLKDPPKPADAAHNLRQSEEGVRRKSQRTSRVEVRVTDDEKRRIELLALHGRVSVSEVFSRMLVLYEQHHGRVELARAKEPTARK